MKRALITALALSILSCSSVNRVYLRGGYESAPAQMIKHIYVVVKAEGGDKDLENALMLIGADMVKANKNYLVHGQSASNRGWQSFCGGFDGIAVFTATEVKVRDGRVDMAVRGELFRCDDKSLVWSADAAAGASSSEKKLENISNLYEEKLGPGGSKYAAPVFSILHDIVQTMPNPELTDEEVNQKIDLESEGEDSARFYDFLYFPAIASS